MLLHSRLMVVSMLRAPIGILLLGSSMWLRDTTLELIDGRRCHLWECQLLLVLELFRFDQMNLLVIHNPPLTPVQQNSEHI